MAGIYIHIPYCKQACYYCNFHFSTSLNTIDAMVEAIVSELELREGYITGDIDSIYFGGGTPSLIGRNAIAAILDRISNLYKVNSTTEITLEANPEDISQTKAVAFKSLGINRISLGIQSFDDKILLDLNRVHSAKQGRKAIEILQQNGFENISVDLIYGIPEQPSSTWEANLAEVVSFGIPHLSCYALSIEEKTAFGKWADKGKFHAVSEEDYEKEYKLMCSYMASLDYEHYEVSNFAKAGYRSRHNSSYWLQQAYLGIGPAAHSYNGVSRQNNISNNSQYIKAIKKGDLPSKSEILSDAQKANEYILTGLRTSNGIDLNRLKDEFMIDLKGAKNAFIQQCIKNKMAVLNDERFILTDKALILADSIIIELMIDEE